MKREENRNVPGETVTNEKGKGGEALKLEERKVRSRARKVMTRERYRRFQDNDFINL